MKDINLLYPEDTSYLKSIWEKHPFFDPSLYQIRKKDVVNALEEGPKSVYFINQVRNSFIPLKDNSVVQKKFVDAMNRGINSINQLLRQFFDNETYEFFKIENIGLPFNFYLFMKEARDDFILSRNAKRPTNIDYVKFLKSYDKLRAFGLGYRVLMIDESPEVLNAIRHHQLILNWFEEQFGFINKRSSGINEENVLNIWDSKSGVNIYGGEKPINSRLKILDHKGKLSYSSLIMKMLLKGQFPDSMNDHTGIEFIVENDEEREKLIRYFRKEIRAMERLENFKIIKSGELSDNIHSSIGYDSVKFILRPPIPTPNAKSSDLTDLSFERIPVEIQILTLEGHKQRMNNPEVEHRAYKERQFMKFFPALFPKEIYSNIMEKN